MTDDTIDVEQEPEEDEVAVAYDIASYPSDLTLSVVKEMWDNGDIEIPDYQRNFVWSIRQSSLLIESFLLGLPVPQVFFYVDEKNKSQVIDGQQRILSVSYFLDGFFGSESIHGKRQVFRLQGLADASPFAKKRFVDLSEPQQRKLKSAVLRAINIRQLNPDGEATSVYHIFERLNTGGTPLKPQEIRNCVYRGGLVGILRKLNEDESWRAILGKSTYDKHQKDVELILRIFALAEYFDSYDKPMKEFLSRIMAKERLGDSAIAARFQRSFRRATQVIVLSLGAKPFHVRGPLNAAVMDAVVATIIQNVDRLPVNLADRFKKLCVDDEFVQTTYYSTSDRVVVQRRFAVVRRHLL